MTAIDSDPGRSMWFSFAPLQPESLEQIIAKRLSVTPARIAVFPPREWPTTPTRPASMSGSVSIQSRRRESAHAHAESVAHDSASRSFSGCTDGNTPCENPAPLRSAATVSKRNAAVAYPRATISSTGQKSLLISCFVPTVLRGMLAAKMNAGTGTVFFGMYAVKGNVNVPFGPLYVTRTSLRTAMPPIASRMSYTSNDTRSRSFAAAGRRPYTSFSKRAKSSGARTFSHSASVFVSAPAKVRISSGTLSGAGAATAAAASADAMNVSFNMA